MPPRWNGRVRDHALVEHQSDLGGQRGQRPFPQLLLVRRRVAAAQQRHGLRVRHRPALGVGGVDAR
jgi:hypothetical protein